MLPTTAEAVRALLKSDPTLTPTDRQRIVNTIREHGRTPEKEAVSAPPPRILRRAEVASRLAAAEADGTFASSVAELDADAVVDLICFTTESARALERFLEG